MLGKQNTSIMRDPPLHEGAGQDCPSSGSVWTKWPPPEEVPSLDSSGLSVQFWFSYSQEIMHASTDCFSRPRSAPTLLNLGTSASVKLHQKSWALGANPALRHGAAKDPHPHPSPPCSLASVGLLRFSVGVC